MVARRRSRRLPALALVVAVLAALLATAAPAPASPSPAAAPAEQSAILFAADGMRPDLVDRFADSGAMPNIRELRRRGVEGGALAASARIYSLGMGKPAAAATAARRVGRMA